MFGCEKLSTWNNVYLPKKGRVMHNSTAIESRTAHSRMIGCGILRLRYRSAQNDGAGNSIRREQAPDLRRRTLLFVILSIAEGSLCEGDSSTALSLRSEWQVWMKLNTSSVNYVATFPFKGKASRRTNSTKYCADTKRLILSGILPTKCKQDKAREHFCGERT